MTTRQTQPWRRRDLPLLSNSPPPQEWCRCGFYAPCVVRANGRFHMWFDGCARPRLDYINHCIGYASSDDGISWQLSPDNPVIRPAQVPWQPTMLASPWVLFDEEEDIFKMWLGTGGPIAERRESGYAVQSHEKLAYATSRDGINWEFHPDPLAEGIRAPCVLKRDDGYRMWINDRPQMSDGYEVAYAHIYEYRSPDGIRWTRQEPARISAGGITWSCVYPSVLEVDGRWYMWHKSHLKEKTPPLNHHFEIFCDVSDDGEHWIACHDAPAFAAADDTARFDWTAVSTPRVIRVEDELWMYYSAQNFEGTFNKFAGSTDGRGMHFGLATMKVASIFSRGRSRTR